MAQPGAGTSTEPAPVDAAEAFLAAHANEACDEEFFQCGAVALAIRLLGQCLFFHDSKIAVRILETEAYPEGDEVYTKKFIQTCDDVKLLSMKRGNLKGGTLLAWSPSKLVGTSEHKDLYITAGPPDRGDLVLIRSCEPILGLDEITKNRKNPTCKKTQKNLLIGPTKVSEGIGAQSWPSNTVLFRDGGVQLFYGARNKDENAKRGKRILGYIHYYRCEGKDSLFRFALATKMNYKYSKKCGGLEDWLEDCQV